MTMELPPVTAALWIIKEKCNTLLVQNNASYRQGDYGRPLIDTRKNISGNLYADFRYVSRNDVDDLDKV